MYKRSTRTHVKRYSYLRVHCTGKPSLEVALIIFLLWPLNFWSMTLTYKLDLVTFKMNQHSKYVGQRPFRSKGGHTHTGPIALPGSLILSANMQDTNRQQRPGTSTTTMTRRQWSSINEITELPIVVSTLKLCKTDVNLSETTSVLHLLVCFIPH